MPPASCTNCEYSYGQRTVTQPQKLPNLTGPTCSGMSGYRVSFAGCLAVGRLLPFVQGKLIVEAPQCAAINTRTLIAGMQGRHTQSCIAKFSLA